MDVFYTILYYSFLMSLLWHTIAVLYFWCIWYTSYTMNFLRSFLFYYNFLFFTILWRILNYESDFYGILFYDLFMIYYSLEFLGTELLNFLLQWLLWNMTLLMVFFMTLSHIIYFHTFYTINYFWHFQAKCRYYSRCWLNDVILENHLQYNISIHLWLFLSYYTNIIHKSMHIYIYIYSIGIYYTFMHILNVDFSLICHTMYTTVLYCYGILYDTTF